MKQEITVSKIEDLQDGDVFVVGNEEWRIQGNELLTPRWNWLRDGSFAIDLIHALGKVKREIPLPEGYRWAAEEEYEADYRALRYCTALGRWSASIVRCAGCLDAYAVPLPTPEQDSNLEKQAVGVECVVVDHAGTGYKIVPVDLAQIAFNPGQRVEVRKVEK